LFFFVFVCIYSLSFCEFNSPLVLLPLIGKYATADKTQCKPCEVGYYCIGGIKSVCESGTFSTASQSFCSACRAGYTCNDDEMEICREGTYSDGTFAECEPCPLGTKCPGLGNKVPITCPDGLYSSTTGSAACHACSDGKICEKGTQRDCPSGFACSGGHVLMCPQGFYSDGGRSECLPCASGTYNPNVKSQSKNDCTACPLFMVTRGNGSATADDCGCMVGYYRNTTGGDTSCIECSTSLLCIGFNITSSEVKARSDNFVVARREDTSEIFTAACPSGACVEVHIVL
jgi:hypothetical protein